MLSQVQWCWRLWREDAISLGSLNRAIISERRALAEASGNATTSVQPPARILATTSPTNSLDNKENVHSTIHPLQQRLSQDQSNNVSLEFANGNAPGTSAQQLADPSPVQILMPTWSLRRPAVGTPPPSSACLPNRLSGGFPSLATIANMMQHDFWQQQLQNLAISQALQAFAPLLASQVTDRSVSFPPVLKPGKKCSNLI